MNPPSTSQISEDDIASFLVQNPGFFERHAQVLQHAQLGSPHGNRAVSLQERQAELLRDKIRVLEQRLMDMLRHGNENVVISDKLHRWVRQLMLTREPSEIPARIVSEIKAQFIVPQVAIRMWDVAPQWADAPFACGVSEDARSFASSLSAPYCGINSGFEAASWLEDSGTVMSLALLALRPGAVNGAAPAFGMLVLGSPDAQRFHAAMGTDFLERIAELASAALSRLRP